MEGVEILGTVAGAITTLTFLPQVIKTSRDRIGDASAYLAAHPARAGLDPLAGVERLVTTPFVERGAADLRRLLRRPHGRAWQGRSMH